MKYSVWNIFLCWSRLFQQSDFRVEPLYQWHWTCHQPDLVLEWWFVLGWMSRLIIATNQGQEEWNAFCSASRGLYEMIIVDFVRNQTWWRVPAYEKWHARTRSSLSPLRFPNGEQFNSGTGGVGRLVVQRLLCEYWCKICTLRKHWIYLGTGVTYCQGDMEPTESDLEWKRKSSVLNLRAK